LPHIEIPTRALFGGEHNDPAAIHACLGNIFNEVRIVEVNSGWVIRVFL
jgi:hypothetical protein